MVFRIVLVSALLIGSKYRAVLFGHQYSREMINHFIPKTIQN